MSLLEFLGISRSKHDSHPPNPLAALLAQHLKTLDAASAERVAAYAGLLVRVARADDNVSDAERNRLIELIEQRAGVNAAQARIIGDLVVRQATELEGIEYALLTRSVNDFARAEDKEKLIDCLYAVATADDQISVQEDEEIRAVARALLLSHAKFIEIRLRYKEKLEVIQSVRKLEESS